MSPPITIALVFIGCFSNVVFLEKIIKLVPGSSNLITASQFAFVSLFGFIFTMKCGQKRLSVPVSAYVTMMLVFFLVSVTNNYALSFDVPMPLHMIFRSGSLVANMLLGVIILKRSYSSTKYISVAMVTVGIILATFASGTSQSADVTESAEPKSKITMAIGIFMLTFALLMSARLGIYQEVLYSTYGRHSQEALFVMHALALPGFLFLYSDILRHIKIFSDSETVYLPVLGIGLPYMWMLLMANVLTSYLCISSVFQLTQECTSLTVTLVLTLRKFISLLFSIWYFNNTFTPSHWVGTALVFGGTMLFSEVFRRKDLKKE